MCERGDKKQEQRDYKHDADQRYYNSRTLANAFSVDVEFWGHIWWVFEGNLKGNARIFRVVISSSNATVSRSRATTSGPRAAASSSGRRKYLYFEDLVLL